MARFFRFRNSRSSCSDDILEERAGYFSEWCKMSSRENPKTRTSRRNSTAHPGKTVASVGCIVYHSRFFIKSENNKKLTTKAGTPFRECFGRFMPRSTCNCPSSMESLRCNPQQLCKSGMHAPLQLCRLPRHCCRCKGPQQMFSQS